MRRGRGCQGGAGRGMRGAARTDQDAFPPIDPFAPASAIPDQVQPVRDESSQQSEAQSGGARMVAWVDPVRCAGCGICIHTCPVEAITVDTVAAIDPERCTGCGECVSACPQGAIVLRKP